MASSGNFSTLNPLSAGTDINDGTMSDGNLKYAYSGADAFRNTMAMTHKTYCEVYINSIGGYGGTIGLCSQQNKRSYEDTICFQINYQSGRIYHYKGSSEQNAGSNNAGSTVSAGQVVMMAYDPATYKWWVGINGTWNGSQDPANGSNPCFTGSATMFEDMSGVFWGGWKGDSNGLTCHWNFGQDSTFAGTITAGGNEDGNGFGDFAYSPPTGFLAHCTGNMSVSDDVDPAQTDDDYPSKQFGIVTYTGTGSSNALTGLGFQPDLVWIKERGATGDHKLTDSSRGVTKSLESNTTNTEATDTNGLTAFGSDGFTVGSDGAYNNSSDTYVSWAWRANGGTTTSDSSGDITVTRQTNDASKFSICTWTGNGVSGSTLPHGLGVAPAMTFIKKLDATSATNVWHQGNNDGDPDSFGELSSTASWYQNQGASGPYTVKPDATNLTLTAYGQVNGSSNTYVGYFWADVDGMQKFGSYEGNGSADGPFIYTGFRPRLFIQKRVDSSGSWRVWDSARHTFNPMDAILRWESSGAEDTANGVVDFLSNGVKIRMTYAEMNASGGDFVYMCWGNVPFKYNNTF